MRKLVALALLTGVLTGLALSGAALAQQRTLTVTIGELNNSGVSGSATLTDLGGGNTRVVIRVNPAGFNDMPVHIHAGTCATLDPRPKWRLNNVVNGESTTEVNVSLAEITANPSAINLHKSAQEATVYTACGTIQMAAGRTPAGLPRAGAEPPGLARGALAAALFGVTFLLGGAALRRR